MTNLMQQSPHSNVVSGNVVSGITSEVSTRQYSILSVALHLSQLNWDTSVLYITCNTDGRGAGEREEERARLNNQYDNQRTASFGYFPPPLDRSNTLGLTRS